MKKLYDFVFSEKEDRKLLYFNGNADIRAQGLYIKEGEKVDFLTYFNSFSINKWKEYTTITKLQIEGKLGGLAEIEIYTIGREGCVLIKRQVHGNFSFCFKIENISGDILGIKINADSDTFLQNVNYAGEFENWEDKKICAVICTFKREDFIKKTINKLVEFSKNNSWLTTLVVDNGSTLEECRIDSLRILHNPNYGGSGGFTRGIIENLKTKVNDYILLMDDDIDLDTTIIERTNSILSTLKFKYRDSFLAGAMLKMDDPYIQHENKAYWCKIKTKGFGRGYNLSDKSQLIDNEKILKKDNQYAGWWYCCIPVKRIEKIGLPLPLFIKGDDIEYSIRNNKPIISMNGIGVWHEAFRKKQSVWINYFSDRNMLIMNNYIKNPNCLFFIIGLFLRILRRLLEFNYQSLFFLDLAIKDYKNGFRDILQKHPYEYINIKKIEAETSKNYKILFSILKRTVFIISNYDQIKREYITFKNNNLFDSKFWIKYLKIG